MAFVHKEYPKVLHKPGGLVSHEIHSDLERDELMRDGWSLRPVLEPIIEPAEAVMETVVDAPKKRGRHKKVTEPDGDRG